MTGIKNGHINSLAPEKCILHKKREAEEAPETWTYDTKQLRSVPDGIYMLEKAHKCSAPSLRSFPSVALETVPVFVWLTVAFSFFQGRLSSASSFHAFLLQAINSVVYLALCLQVLYQPPQHFRSLETQATCDGYFACQSICLSFPFTLACPGQCSGCQPLTHSSMVFTFHS